MVCSHQADEKLFSHWEEVRAQEILKQLHPFTAGLPGIQHTVIRRPAESKLAIAHSHGPVD
jgi:hypothetical protein